MYALLWKYQILSFSQFSFWTSRACSSNSHLRSTEYINPMHRHHSCRGNCVAVNSAVQKRKFCMLRYIWLSLQCLETTSCSNQHILYSALPTWSVVAYSIYHSMCINPSVNVPLCLTVGFALWRCNMWVRGGLFNECANSGLALF